MELFQACIAQGWEIFPVRGKVPAIKWKAGACRTWESWPEGFGIGIATGARSGIVVVDDDRRKHGYSAWEPPVCTANIRTHSGGRHYYYRHPGGVVRNSVGRVAEYVDVRGDGGFVVCYGIPEGEIAPCPEGLVSTRPTRQAPVYVLPAHRGALQSGVLSGAAFGGEGSRNNTLFRLACIFVENNMDVGVLYQGAINAGLDPSEVDRTIQSVRDRMVVK